MRFVIERKKWLRGKGGAASSLRDPESGEQCCVGQMCSQLGIPDTRLDGKSVTSDLFPLGEANRLGPLANASGCPEDWLDRAYLVNDDREINDFIREKRLTELLTAHGHELVFTD